ncbi:MAG: phosphate signaling complex protein PhoU [Burkholderiales bacterium]
MRSIDAISSCNLALIEQIVADDHKVNALEVEMDDMCNHVIARRQPAADDLRLIVAVVKTVTDLERIGDEAEKIAHVAKLVCEVDRLHARFTEIRRMGDLALGMVRMALDAFARLDPSTATRVAREDMLLDEVPRDPAPSHHLHDGGSAHDLLCLEIVFAAKALKSASATTPKNISEYVIFLVKGKDVRHTTVEQLEREALRPAVSVDPVYRSHARLLQHRRRRPRLEQFPAAGREGHRGPHLSARRTEREGSARGRTHPEKYLDEASQERALDCLRRFGERIPRPRPARGARDQHQLLRWPRTRRSSCAARDARAGLPDRRGGRARRGAPDLLEVVQSLPPSNARRLVADIGGGSAEFIIGAGLEPRKLSLYMGCVSHGLRYFPSRQGHEGNFARRNSPRAASSRSSLPNSPPATGSRPSAPRGRRAPSPRSCS